MFDLFQTVHTDNDESEYVAERGDAYYKTSKGKRRDEKGRRAHCRAWRAFQMSDHLPMWIELKIDSGGEYLKAGRDRRGDEGVAADA